VLESIGYEENADGELVDRNGKVVTSQEFEQIKSEDFG